MYIDKHGSAWYKGNLHTHTTESDGAKTPEEAIALYRDSGYDFLAVTDHWKLSETYVHENGMLVLGGCEYDFGTNSRDGIFHIVAVGCTKDTGILRSDSPQDAIDKIHAAGGLACLAHPCWSMNTLDHLMPLEHVDYSEIFNTTSDLPRNYRPYSGEILDAMAVRGKYWNLAAADDTHTYITDACRSFVYVQAENCSAEAILEAIRNGKFYASQGPRMEITREGNTVTITCPAEDGVDCIVGTTDTVWESHRTEMGENLTSASFEIPKRATFFRFEIRDAQGRWAWSSYIPK